MLSGSALSFMPLLALAQQRSGGTCDTLPGGGTTVQGIICVIGDIFDLAIPVLVILGVLYFVWGVVSYVIASDEEAKKKGKDRMIYGLIGLVVITALWGLVAILTRTFGISTTATVTTPGIIGF